MIKNISGICVINLDSRQDRWLLFESNLNDWKSFFGAPPERVSAVLGTDLPGFGKKPWFSRRMSEKRKRSWAGKAGCVLSHRKAIALAESNNWDNVFILEDDASISKENVIKNKSIIANIIKLLPSDWCVIYFCTSTVVGPCRLLSEIDSTKIFETTGALGTVAYLLNGSVYKKILAELPKQQSVWEWVARHKTIDRWFSQNLVRFGKVYVIAPSLVGHCLGNSDISMTSENAQYLDFSLRNIKYTNNGIFFYLTKLIRFSCNIFNRFGSFFRYYVKRYRGL